MIKIVVDGKRIKTPLVHTVDCECGTKSAGWSTQKGDKIPYCPNCSTWNKLKNFRLSGFYLGLFVICFVFNVIMGVKNAFSIGFIQSVVFFVFFLVLHLSTRPLDKPK